MMKDILQIAVEKSGHSIQVSVDPQLKREQDIVRLHGDRRKLDGIAGERIDFSIDATIEWMLSTP